MLTAQGQKRPWLASDGFPKTAIWLLGLVLAGGGARLWLIHAYGTPLPFWDQWEDARTVFTPFLQGQLSWALLFSPNGEHHIVVSRLYNLGLFLLGGQFDNVVQMVANVVLYSATMAGIGWLLARQSGRTFWPLISHLMLLALALPFAFENTLGGFHSVFYFMVLLSWLTMWLLGFHPAGSGWWFCGVAAAFLSLLNLGSGFIAVAAVLGLVGLRIIRQPSEWRRYWVTAIVCIAVIPLGLALKVDAPYHRVLMAHSVAAWLVSLGKYLAWPWIVLPPYAVFNMFPLAMLAWVYLRSHRTRMPAEELVLVGGVWAFLQVAASAYARGGLLYPQWRYMDTTCFVMIANALSLALLWTRHADQLPCLRYFRAATFLWALGCLLGLTLLCWRAWSFDIPLRHMFHRLQMVTARAYLATGDQRYLKTHFKEYLAAFAGPDKEQDHPRAFVAAFDAPHVHDYLPACVRAPLNLAPQKAAGFVTNSARLVRPNLPGEVSWSSFTSAGDRSTGYFESQPIAKSRTAFLEFRVSGSLGEPGLSLAIQDLRSGRLTSIRPCRISTDEWQECRVKAPPGEFRIIARDDSTNGWLAFQAPRELSGLSWAAGRLAAAGRGVFFFGLALLLAGWWRAWRWSQAPGRKIGMLTGAGTTAAEEAEGLLWKAPDLSSAPQTHSRAERLFSELRAKVLNPWIVAAAGVALFLLISFLWVFHYDDRKEVSGTRGDGATIEKAGATNEAKPPAEQGRGPTGPTEHK